MNGAMNDANENFEEINLLHRTSIRIPKKHFNIKEIGYEDEEDFLIINIDYNDTLETIKTNHDLGFTQLLGRALARTRINEPLKSTWTFISAEDLEKTRHQSSPPSFFHQIIQNIRNLLPSQPTAVLLWQDKESVLALINSGDEENKIFGPYKNFSEAEIKIQQILKENINNV